MPLPLLFSHGFWAKRKILLNIAALALVMSVFLYTTAARAQQPPRGPVDADLKEDIILGTVGTIGGTPDGANGFGVTDPRVIAGKIINGLLVLVGVAFLIMMLYAGFLYMTARGANEQVEKSLSIIRRAIVGVAIVLLSLSITRFVEYMFVGRAPSGGNTFVGIGGAGTSGSQYNVSAGVRQGTARSMGCWAWEAVTFSLGDC